LPDDTILKLDFMYPDLSIILPSHKDARLALRSAGQAAAFFNGGRLSWELLIVDDGGGDFGAEDPFADPRIKLIRMQNNQGKGAAVRRGMLAARGRVRIYSDADLPYGLQMFPLIAEYILERGFHVVIGDRTLPGSSYALDVGWRRRVASSAFSKLVGTLVTGGFFDTQCGLKGFRGDVSDALFKVARVDRFAFDAELIYLSLLHRLDIKRIPVQLKKNEASSVRLMRDSRQMLFDTLGIKRNQLKGIYESKALREIVSNDHDALQSSLRVPQNGDREASAGEHSFEKSLVNHD
jgi:dolichyl-phosphate beta-glucosyltransferase